METKTYWKGEPDKDISLWKKGDDKDKPRKVTPNEPRTWKQDMDNLRETMRKSHK